MKCGLWIKSISNWENKSIHESLETSSCWDDYTRKWIGGCCCRSQSIGQSIYFDCQQLKLKDNFRIVDKHQSEFKSKSEHSSLKNKDALKIRVMTAANKSDLKNFLTSPITMWKNVWPAPPLLQKPKKQVKFFIICLTCILDLHSKWHRLQHENAPWGW